MYNIVAIFVSITIPIIMFWKEFEKKNNIDEFFKCNKRVIIIYFIFVVGFLVRTIGITNFPNGLNCDEASIGYEAYSVLTYGIDRNGDSWPAFLESWGSGQNTLYMYIIMPFIKILGLSVFSVRLPMAIIGCISLVIMYKLLLKTNNKELAIIGIAFFAITPWHIMKSRYGLESNVFPDFMLYAIYFIITALKEQNKKKYYIGAIFLGLCSYAYGTSYYFLPIFTIILLIFLLKKKEMSLKEAFLFLVLIFIISLPIILMIFINTFDFNEIHFWKLTIPKLEENRYEILTVFSSENKIEALLSNFYASIKMLLFQVDGFNSNGLDFFGIVYIFSFPIIIIGIMESFYKKQNINTIFNIWFIVAFFLGFICIPNINRMNILYIPLIFYVVLGIYKITSTLEWTKMTIFLIYLVAFLYFEITYFNTDYTETETFTDGVKNVIQYIDNKDVDNIYIEHAFKEPYIYILFFNKENTKDFVETAKYRNNFKGFESVTEFGKYKFYLPVEIDNEENNCYVMRESTKDFYDIDEKIWRITYIDQYCVLEKIIN